MRVEGDYNGGGVQQMFPPSNTSTSCACAELLQLATEASLIILARLGADNGGLCAM